MGLRLSTTKLSRDHTKEQLKYQLTSTLTDKSSKTESSPKKFKFHMNVLLRFQSKRSSQEKSSPTELLTSHTKLKRSLRERSKSQEPLTLTENTLLTRLLRFQSQEQLKDHTLLRTDMKFQLTKLLRSRS